MKHSSGYDAVRIESADDDHRRELRSRPTAAAVESFDRVALALRLLSHVHLERTRVAVFEHRGEMLVERARALPRGESWAMLAIPPDASRQHIAVAIAELAGISRVPFAADLLALEGSDTRAC